MLVAGFFLFYFIFFSKSTSVFFRLIVKDKVLLYGCRRRSTRAPLLLRCSRGLSSRCLCRRGIFRVNTVPPPTPPRDQSGSSHLIIFILKQKLAPFPCNCPRLNLNDQSVRIRQHIALVSSARRGSASLSVYGPKPGGGAFVFYQVLRAHDVVHRLHLCRMLCVPPLRL